MSGEGTVVAVFKGQAISERASEAIFTLSGVDPEPLIVTFSAPAPADLPATLESPRIERLDDTHYRLSAGQREWLLIPRAVHLHRGVPSFYTVIRPRVPPWKRRLLWRALLALAALPAGLAVLRRLRR